MQRLTATFQGAQSAARAAELIQRQARDRAVELAAAMRRTAKALEQSADLADDHARRRRRQGQHQAVVTEQAAADRARTAAQQARDYADQWQSA